jgi:hypothetical protein
MDEMYVLLRYFILPFQDAESMRRGTSIGTTKWHESSRMQQGKTARQYGCPVLQFLSA